MSVEKPAIWGAVSTQRFLDLAQATEAPKPEPFTIDDLLRVYASMNLTLRQKAMLCEVNAQSSTAPMTLVCCAEMQDDVEAVARARMAATTVIVNEIAPASQFYAIRDDLVDLVRNQMNGGT